MRKMASSIIIIGGLLMAAPLAAAVPEHAGVVQQVFKSQSWDLSTKEGCGQFTEAVAVALHAKDAKWGLLRKSPAQNNYNGHAVDAVLYLGTGQAVDIIVDSVSVNARPGWLVDIPRYGPGDWLAPTVGGGDPGDPPPPPPPTNLGEQILTELRETHSHVAALEVEINALQAQNEALTFLVEALMKVMGEVRVDTQKIINTPVPVYRGRVLGFPIRLTPEEVNVGTDVR